MKNRREFLQQAVTGAVATSAVLAGTKDSFAFAKRALKPLHDDRARVVIARDPDLHDAFRQPIESRLDALLDRAIATYTGIPRSIEAWRQIVGNAQVIGIKTNGLGGKGISSHAVLVYAIAARLQSAGIQPGNIIIWDRNARDLQACGLAISVDHTKVRCFGSDVSGYEDATESFGAARVRLSKILAQCDMVIGVPILKDHSMAGVTFAMKNMYGVVDRPQDLHAGGCCPGVADLNCIPAIRQKVRFTIGDALSSVYDGGPGFHPERLWYPNALVIGEDRVALDHTAWQLLERKRAEAGIPTLEAAGRPPRYIAVAADSDHALGTNDPARIHLMEV